MKKRKFVTRRCTIKIQILFATIFIFSIIHFQYMSTIDHENLEKLYTIPDNLMMKHSSKGDKRNKMIQTNNRKFDSGTTLQNPEGIDCQPRRGVVFLKTHKTGSTTMTNIFLRFAEKHKLAVGLPPLKKWELGGYPGFFNKKLVDPQLKQYEMLCHHFRMDTEVVSQIVPADTLYITILRDPANAFESGFSFFRDGPFSTWMPNYENEDALEQFIESPKHFYNKSTPWYFRAKNYQSFDLGFDNDREDEDYIKYVRYKMDDLFNLVLITEKFEESLILLKDSLCMESLEDILHIRLKVRQNSMRRKSNDKLKRQMREWNKIDTMIYDYFLNRLNEKIQGYGIQRMTNEVEQLKKMLQEIEEKCVLEYDHDDLRSWISRIRIKKDSGEFCDKLSWGEVRFGDFIRTNQRKYLNIVVEEQIPADNMRRMLEEEQNKILNV
uniref:galactosylceramide sulfotransferase-like isoform X1 n=2 Tax=Styela clava TaxID=7725 RepID=UPI00193A9A7A|nr:galactosylceramide sulfotransferase-like isoform X1 [Styela clava]